MLYRSCFTLAALALVQGPAYSQSPNAVPDNADELGGYEYVARQAASPQKAKSRLFGRKDAADSKTAQVQASGRASQDGWYDLERYGAEGSAASSSKPPSRAAQEGWQDLDSLSPPAALGTSADEGAAAAAAPSAGQWIDFEDDLHSIKENAPLLSPELKAGDIVDIFIKDVETVSGRYTLSDIGTINLPLIGNIRASGLLPDRLAANLSQIYGQEYLVNPTFTVTMQDRILGQVELAGKVNAPGDFSVTRAMPLADILAKGAGVRGAAKEHDAVILRQSGDRIKARRVALAGIKRFENPGPTILPGDSIRVVEREKLPELDKTALPDLPLLQNVLSGGAPTNF